MKKKNTWFRFRVSVIFCVFILFFGVIFFRAFQIQVLKGDALVKMAENQQTRVLELPFKRGGIYDRHFEELAVSREVDSVFIQPARVKDKKELQRLVLENLDVSKRELKKKLDSSKNFVWLKRQVDLTTDVRKAIKMNAGIGFLKESRRYYPNKELASNLIGFTGIDGGGLEGVELVSDHLLRGASKKVTVNKDAKGNLLLFEDIDSNLQGVDISLTIDKKIQYISDKALKNAVTKANARGGTAIVMNPHTGEILAMSSMPTYDPNTFGSFTPSDWRNRAVTDSFEPGSTIKPFVVAAAIDEGLVNEDSIFYCEKGEYKLQDRVFHDGKEYGWLSASNIIKHSSNIGAIKIGEKLGKVKLYRSLKSFGLGERTGSALPGEARGSLRHYSKWSGVSLYTISFGQGIAVTTLQLASAVSVIANGGYLMKPRIVKNIKSPDGKIIEKTEPIIRRKVISPGTARKVTEMMKLVTGEGGTGKLSSFDGFKVAGKTGTAQKADLKKGGYEKGKYIASFVGFVPADDPMLAIVVTIDEPEGSFAGGVIAAPVFKEIAKQTLNYLGVVPGRGSDGFGGQVVATSKLNSDARLVSTAINNIKEKVDDEEEFSFDGTVPDFTGRTMRRVVRMANKNNMNVVFKGSGTAVSQSPKPGKILTGGNVVTVVFK